MIQQPTQCVQKAREFQAQCISQGLNGNLNPQILRSNNLMSLFGMNTGSLGQPSGVLAPFITFDVKFYQTSEQLDQALGTFCGNSCDQRRQELLQCNLGNELMIQKQVFCQRTSNQYCYSFYFERMGPRMWEWEYNLPDPDTGKPEVVCHPCTSGIFEVLRQFTLDPAVPSTSISNPVMPVNMPNIPNPQQQTIGSVGPQNMLDRSQARNVYSQLFSKYTMVCPNTQAVNTIAAMDPTNPNNQRIKNDSAGFSILYIFFVIFNCL
eukprot:NODE_106_length_19060_cov_0.700227.p8 type:complete len:265 gc:universal NODE_106_length_19060_cov_0.700227:4912-5706(+)